MNQDKIRNFSIIAHIDHGKSTLADRILEKTGSIDKREMKDQLLDNMDIERERGITIKLNAVELKYKGYTLNLIDTPGHVDFTYEVSRSLAASEGALLIVDATQGIQAQTLSNVYLALNNNLMIIPVINKIDLPNASPELRAQELMDTFGFTKDEIIFTSGKTGEGVDTLLDAIIERIPSPKGIIDAPPRCLIFDSYFDPYLGVVSMVRVVDGKLKVGNTIKMLSTNACYDIVQLGVNTPKPTQRNILTTGSVGFVVASIKSIDDVKVGDTMTLKSCDDVEPLPGYKEVKPMVFCGLYPIDSKKYPNLREALEKLKLNDSSLTIEREFNIELIATSPSVVYQIELTDGSTIYVDNPTKFPDRVKIKAVKEPYIKTDIFLPSTYIGSVMELCQNKRGTYLNMEYLDEKRVNIHYEMPLSEVVYDFFDKLKSYTKGYASLDYEIIGYKESDLVKMDILINGETVDALSIIVHKDFTYKRGKVIVENLKKIIPRQQFEVPIQAVIGSKVIARSDIKAMRKNVLAKCYGGDITRKRKLLEKQKEGKKRMKQIGKVEIPQEAFLSILSTDEKETS